MPLKTNVRDVGWWFAAIILLFIVVALVGWRPGYYVVMLLSGLQAVYFIGRERSLVTISAQIGIVYFALTLFGVWTLVRVTIYAFLLLGTFMVVFLDKCSIEFMLKQMPWNKGR